MSNVTIAELQDAIPASKNELVPIYQYQALNPSGFTGDTRRIEIGTLLGSILKTYIQYPELNAETIEELFLDGKSPPVLLGGNWNSEIVPVGALPPDYANYDSTNRITTNNGIWTADRKGWVRAGIAGAAVGNTCVIRKNDITIHIGVNTHANWIQEMTFPVVPGDVILISTNGTPAAADWTRNPFTTIANAANLKWSGCYFIPEITDPLEFPQGFIKKYTYMDEGI